MCITKRGLILLRSREFPTIYKYGRYCGLIQPQEVEELVGFRVRRDFLLLSCVLLKYLNA